MAELIRSFISDNVPSKDAKAIQESFLTKNTNGFQSIVMTKRKRPQKVRMRLRKGALTSGTRRALGFHKLTKTGQQYSDYLPLNGLWQQYMTKYLGLDKALRDGFRADPEDGRTDHCLLQLCRADYHGARLLVLRSRCASYVGVTGLVLLETRGTFQLLTPDNKIKMIPKQHSVFETSIEGFKVRLFGDNLLSRPAGRGMKKLKARKTIEL